MTSVNHYSRILVSASALWIGMSCVAHAAEPTASEEIVKFRQSVMLSQRGHMAAAAAIIQGKVEFKDQLAVHAKALEGTTQDIASLFPQGTDVGETKALKEVWTNNDEFRKLAKDAQQKAAALSQAVAAGDSMSYGQRLKDLSESCKACHKDFRKKEEK